MRAADKHARGRKKDRGGGDEDSLAGRKRKKGSLGSSKVKREPTAEGKEHGGAQSSSAGGGRGGGGAPSQRAKVGVLEDRGAVLLLLLLCFVCVWLLWIRQRGYIYRRQQTGFRRCKSFSSCSRAILPCCDDL